MKTFKHTKDYKLRLKGKHLFLPFVAILCSTTLGFASEHLEEPQGVFSGVKGRCDHIALPYKVENKTAMIQFYEKTLGLDVFISGQDNLLVKFLGTNLVFHPTKEEIPSLNIFSEHNPLPPLHFGVQSLTMDEFSNVANAFSSLNILVGKIKILNEGLENEERTLYFKDPTGYALECRYQKNPNSFVKGQREFITDISKKSQ